MQCKVFLVSQRLLVALKPFEAMKVAVCIMMLLMSGIGRKNWKLQKKRHKPELVNTMTKLAEFARLSNENNFNSYLNNIMIPRVPGTMGHAKVRKTISTAMKRNGWAVEEDSFTDQTPLGEKRFTNIIATLNPNSARRLVIACHYDSKIDPPGVYATDSAVPCAMMLNLASTLRVQLAKLQKKKPNLTLQFIFFDGKEAFQHGTDKDSIYGSRNLAKKWENQRFSCGKTAGNYNDRIDMFVLLDLLGSSDMSISMEEETTSRWYRELFSIEDRLRNKWFNSGRKIFRQMRGSGGIADDHLPFKRRGVPILHLISTPFPSVWHTAGDNRDALDFGLIANFNRILRIFVAEYLHIVNL